MSPRKFERLTVCEWQDSGVRGEEAFFLEVGALVVGVANILNVSTKLVTHRQRDIQTDGPKRPFRRLRVLRHV